MPGVLTRPGLVADGWLGERLGRSVYRLETDGLSELPAAAARQRVDAARAGAPLPSMIWARAPVEDVALVGVLERAGFNLVDTGLTLERPRFGRGEGRFRFEIRPAVAEDRLPVAALARASFRCSRFHRDPAIPQAVADEIKAEWTGSFFRGRRGDAMAVAADGARVIGFLLGLTAGDGAMVIDLVAVDAAYRGRRIAGDLTRFAQTQFAAADVLRVGTQLANPPALRGYQRLGFTVVGASYVLHLHLK
jgi:ribosomal protein S18 acetylase RimI-like enzyme